MRHGFSKTRLYNVWYSMKKRCDNVNVEQYKNYGARGINVCDEWRKDFLAFRTWAIANGYDENAEYGKYTIDRIDVNGNYSPENCRWVNWTIQQNNRRNNHRLRYNRQEKTLSELESITGIKQLTLRYRAETSNDPFAPIFQPKTLCFNGETHTISQWAKLLNLSPNAIYRRIKKGWSLEKVLSPKQRRCKSNE